ncbi:hypothetical protein CS0771_58580 [Catellatospora sp. IY07-71]|uniref:hypothetical protein n=1 Tax=Catellatospora sp. IY07-71 TaxID=2728827 RepID=UPI001BB3EA1D|nr:hypothetical protein [Catellatospora sp. IY07-71]BCJ76314.1 hypothetical protein CS0771_58580 [Catellatospora sp. IY07-71]
MYLFERDSIVVSTAAELLAAHQPLADSMGSCATCGATAPCLTAINARQIAEATTAAWQPADL